MSSGHDLTCTDCQNWREWNCPEASNVGAKAPRGGTKGSSRRYSLTNYVDTLLTLVN